MHLLLSQNLTSLLLQRPLCTNQPKIFKVLFSEIYYLQYGEQVEREQYSVNRSGDPKASLFVLLDPLEGTMSRLRRTFG